MDYITDDVMKKIEDDMVKMLVKKGITPSILFFDTTNFFTYIEHGEDLPKKGKSKEKRYDKNLIGLGLAVSDENIPLFHETFPGNIHDSKVFAMIFDRIINRLSTIEMLTEDIVMIIDKGCNSKKNIDAVLSKMHIVGSVKKNQVEELFDIPLTDFKLLYTNKKGHRVMGYQVKKELFGTEFTVVVSYNSGSYKKQKETYEKDKAIVLEKLEKIKRSVERDGRGKKKRLKNALIDASKVVFDEYKTIFLFEGNEKDNLFIYHVDEKAEVKLSLTFGKNVVFSDMHEWNSERIVKTYNMKDFIEKDFEWIKDLLIIPFKPIYLQKDKRIKVHSFLCVMGLLFYRYLLWKLKKQNERLSENRVIELLNKIRVAFVKRDDEKPQFVFESMDLDQLRLFTELRLETILRDTRLAV